MDTSKLFWSLFNRKTQRQIDGLTFTQVKGLIDSFSDDLESWDAWHENLPEWKPVTEFAEFSSSISQKGARVPAAAPKHSMQTNKVPPAPDYDTAPALEFGTDNGPANIDFEGKGHVDNRMNRRFRQTYDVQIQSGDAVLMNQTVDISLGGMALRNDLPLTIAGHFGAQLSNAGGAVLAVWCSPILDKRGYPKNRVKFHLTPENEIILRTWLLNATENQDES